MLRSHGHTLTLWATFIAFSAQILLVPLAEASIWDERRQQKQLAALPASPLSTAFPRVQRTLTETPTLKKNSLSKDHAFSLFSDAVTHHTRLESIALPKGRLKGRVILIQDVHMNPEAQTNIAHTLQNLINTEKIDVVGVEGAFKALPLERFRFFKDKNLTRSIMKAFLKAGQMAAPSYVGITSPIEPPLMIGVDDKAHYDANVTAYLDARDQKEALIQKRSKKEESLRAKKLKIYSSALQKVDVIQYQYRKGDSSLTDYLRTLSKHQTIEKESLTQFLKAASIEEEMDFNRVEQERRRVVQMLAKRMTEEEMQSLIAISLRYRDGQLRFGDYYRHIETLSKEKGVDLANTPEFKKYIRYVVMADGIQASQLFDDLRSYEKSIFTRLATTQEQKDLVQASRRFYLEGNLIDFALTPEEWNEYNRVPRTASRVLPTFERFYQEADIRSEKIVENLLNASQNAARRSQNMVLVIGGFHTTHIVHELKKRDIATLVLSPTVTKVDTKSGTSYLSVFSREKTPLDRLFEGKKLTVNPDRANVTHPTLYNQALSTLAAQAFQNDSAVALPNNVDVTSPQPGLFRVVIDGAAHFLSNAKQAISGFIKRTTSPTGWNHMEAAPSLATWSIWDRFGIPKKWASLLEPLTLVAFVGIISAIVPFLFSSSNIGIVIVRLMLAMAVNMAFVALHYQGVYKVGSDGRTLIFERFENWDQRLKAWSRFTKWGFTFHWPMILLFSLSSFLPVFLFVFNLVFALIWAAASHYYYNQDVIERSDVKESGFSTLPSFNRLNRNEDYHYSFDSPKGRVRIRAVLDGVGGYPGGATASRLAAILLDQNIRELLADYASQGIPEESLDQDDIETILKKAMRETDDFLKDNDKITQGIYGMIKNYPELKDDPDMQVDKKIGKTAGSVSLVWTRPDGDWDIYTAQSGDTRVYLRVNEGGLETLTLDAPKGGWPTDPTEPDIYDLDNLSDEIWQMYRQQAKMDNARWPSDLTDQEFNHDHKNRNVSDNFLGLEDGYKMKIYKKSVSSKDRVRLVYTSDGVHDALTLIEIDNLTRFNLTPQEANEEIEMATINQRNDLIAATEELGRLYLFLEDSMRLSQSSIKQPSSGFVSSVQKGIYNSEDAWEIQEWVEALVLEYREQYEKVLRDLKGPTKRFSSEQTTALKGLIKQLNQLRGILTSDNTDAEVLEQYKKAGKLVQLINDYYDVKNFISIKLGFTTTFFPKSIYELIEKGQFHKIPLEGFEEQIEGLKNDFEGWYEHHKDKLDESAPDVDPREIRSKLKKLQRVHAEFNYDELIAELNASLQETKSLTSAIEIILEIRKQFTTLGIAPAMKGKLKKIFQLLEQKKYGEVDFSIILQLVKDFLKHATFELGEERLETFASVEKRLADLQEWVKQPSFMRLKIDDATSAVVDLPRVDQHEPIATWGTETPTLEDKLLTITDSLPSDLRVRTFNQTLQESQLGPNEMVRIQFSSGKRSHQEIKILKTLGRQKAGQKAAFIIDPKDRAYLEKKFSREIKDGRLHFIDQTDKLTLRDVENSIDRALFTNENWSPEQVQVVFDSRHDDNFVRNFLSETRFDRERYQLLQLLTDTLNPITMEFGWNRIGNLKKLRDTILSQA